MTKRLLFQWLPVFICAGLIFFLSSYSNPYQAVLPKGIQDGSNINLPNISIHTEQVGEVSHLFIYIIFGSLVMRALNKISNPSFICIALGISILYSLSDEFHQLFVPGRAFQLTDLAIDTIGSLFGILLYYWFASYRRTGTKLE